MDDKAAVAGLYLQSVLSNLNSGVTFPCLAGMDATISGCGNPKEFGTVFAVGVHLVLRLDLVSPGTGGQNVHCPAARIGTSFFSVFGLHPTGRLLRRLDNT